MVTLTNDSDHSSIMCLYDVSKHGSGNFNIRSKNYMCKQHALWDGLCNCAADEPPVALLFSTLED
jgi:hypothetical protein